MICINITLVTDPETGGWFFFWQIKGHNSTTKSNSIFLLWCLTMLLKRNKVIEQNPNEGQANRVIKKLFINLINNVGSCGRMSN